MRFVNILDMFKSCEVPTTWQEISTYYRAWLKSVTHSEFDRLERGPICYAQPGESKETPGLDFLPLIFQSIFYVQTRKGFTFFCMLV